MTPNDEEVARIMALDERGLLDYLLDDYSQYNPGDDYYSHINNAVHERYRQLKEARA
ncbi:hypothetical protein BPNPMPFG_002485 [Mesorhizobium sp. AR07]|uniref:hypothetical protein n=1 Tax=Mesorhizobium sp. AR07 TaxID=2865838 RepID=UPI00215E42EA|nr:hypothetical protein [Mesorhizobium sp. AR07]UVK46777.1 hypothetical protein BPNPMPFG_002485 [Mesorhizobium sp. AR07]